MALTLPRAPILFLSAILVLVGLVLTNIVIVENYSDPANAHFRDVTQGEVSVLRHTVYVAPGNVLRLPAMAFNTMTPNHVSFYIVEGGQGRAPAGTEPTSAYLYGSESEFVAGRTPPIVYYSDTAPVAIDGLEFRRPEPPSGKAHFEPEGWNPKIDEYESLDLVWVFDRSTVPAEELGLANNVWNRATGSTGVWGGFDFVSPMEINGFWLGAQPFIFALHILAVVGVALAAGYWFLSARKGTPKREATGPMEGFLQIANSAEGYLRHLRQLGLLNGVLLGLGGFFGIVAANYYTSTGAWWAYPTPSWNEWLILFLVISYLALVAMWFVHYRRLTSEFRRVKAHMAQPPIVA